MIKKTEKTVKVPSLRELFPLKKRKKNGFAVLFKNHLPRPLKQSTRSI